MHRDLMRPMGQRRSAKPPSRGGWLPLPSSRDTPQCALALAGILFLVGGMDGPTLITTHLFPA